ncbi:MAG: hypothetical protein Q8R16_04070, partial [bacterium]|nr:hypothetical protein [bacterium]
MKPEPLTVMVPPGELSGAEVGTMLVMAGIGLVTVKMTVLDVPPPGAGVKTVMFLAPTVVKSEAGMATVNRVAET